MARNHAIVPAKPRSGADVPAVAADEGAFFENAHHALGDSFVRRPAPVENRRRKAVM